eukprot:gene32130-16653_t
MTARKAVGAVKAAAVQLSSVLQHFPPIQHAFAYGSGVKRQPGLYDNDDGSTSLPQTATSSQDTSQAPMIDLIFAVDNAKEWHEQNLAKNPGHYSWLCRF